MGRSPAPGGRCGAGALGGSRSARTTPGFGAGPEPNQITGRLDVPRHLAEREVRRRDQTSSEPYLADISDSGELTRIGAIPAHDDVVVSPGARWLASTTPGTTGGEVASIPALQAQPVDGTLRATLTAPAGWGFRVRERVWEDDDHSSPRWPATAVSAWPGAASVDLLRADRCALSPT